MAHMQQGPQAAFTAMFGLPAPNLDPSSTSQQFPPIPMPPPKLPTTLSPTISGFSAPTSGFSALVRFHVYLSNHCIKRLTQYLNGDAFPYSEHPSTTTSVDVH